MGFVFISEQRANCATYRITVSFYNMDVIPYNPVVNMFTTSFTFNYCTLWSQCIYKFCICLWKSSDSCHLQYKLIGLYNIDLTLYNPVVTICTASLLLENVRSAHTLFIIFCLSENKRLLVPPSAYFNRFYSID